MPPCSRARLSSFRHRQYNLAIPFATQREPRYRKWGAAFSWAGSVRGGLRTARQRAQKMPVIRRNETRRRDYWRGKNRGAHWERRHSCRRPICCGAAHSGGKAGALADEDGLAESIVALRALAWTATGMSPLPVHPEIRTSRQVRHVHWQLAKNDDRFWLRCATTRGDERDLLPTRGDAGSPRGSRAAAAGGIRRWRGDCRAYSR